MPYPYSLDDYVKDLSEYMYKNSIVKPHVIAHSFGGRIVLKSHQKDLFDKIVLTGSAGLKPRFSVKKRIRVATFNLLKQFVPREKLTAFYSSDYVNLSLVMKESFKLIINEHLDYTLPMIENPTLIINGKNDKETPPYMAKRFAKNIKNSKLILLENAGHFCFIDRASKFNWEVREFLLHNDYVSDRH